MSRLKIVMRWLLALSFGLLSLLLLLFVSLQFESTRSLWLGLMDGPLAENNLQLNIQGVQGIVPIDFSMQQLQIRELDDDARVWLQLDEFKLNWSLLSLLSRQLKIQELSAKRLKISHIPKSISQDRQAPKEIAEHQTDSSNLFISGFSIEKLEWPWIELGSEVLGLKPPSTSSLKTDSLYTSISADGIWNPGNNIARIRLKLPYLTWQTSTATEQSIASEAKKKVPLQLILDYRQQQKQLKLDAELQLNEKFLAPFLSEQEIQTGHIAMFIHGDGPLSQWQGELQLQSEQLFDIQSRLKLQALLNTGAGLDLNRIDGLLTDSQIHLKPALIKYLIPEQSNIQNEIIKNYANLQLKTNLAYQQGQLTIQDLKLDSSLLQWTSRGMLDSQGEKIQINSQLHLAELKKLRFLMSEPQQAAENTNLNGKLRLSIDAKGSFEKPQLEFQLQTEQFQLNQLAIANIDVLGKVLVNPAAKNANTGASGNVLKPHIQLDGQGTLKQLAMPSSGLPNQDIQWQFSAIKDHQEQVKISQFNITSPIFDSDLNGQIDLDQLTGQFDWQALIHDFAMLIPQSAESETGQKLSGSKQLQAKIHIHPNAEQIDLNLSGDLKRLQGIPMAVQGLLGENPNWQALVHLYQQKQLVLENLKVDTQALQVSAQGQLELDSGVIKGQIGTLIADLNPLSEILSTPLHGSLQSQLHLKGSLAEPTLELSLDVQQLEIAERILDSFNLDARIEQILQQPRGQLAVKLGPDSEQIKLDATWLLQTQQIKIPQLTLSAPQTALQGELNYDLKQSLLDGKISGKMHQLEALEFWHQQPLQGDLAVDLQLAASKAQELSLNLQSKQLLFADTQLKKLHMSSRLSSLKQQAKMQSELNITSLKQGDYPIGSLNLNLNGTVDKLSIDLSHRNPGKKLSLDILAQLQQTDESILLHLQQIQGKALKQTLRLIEPVDITMVNQQLDISPFQLHYGQAKLKLNGRADFATQGSKNPLDVKLSIKDFDLRRIADLNLPQAELSLLSGLLNAQINLYGNMAKPQLESRIEVQKLGLQQRQTKNLPLLDLQLDSYLKKNQLKSQLQLSGLSQQAITAQANLPLQLSLKPWQFILAKEAPLSARFNAEMDLNDVAEWIQLDQQLLKGNLSSAIKLSGNLQNPLLNGDVRLTQGHYENGILGVILKQINFATQINNNHIQITDLSGNDGAQGGFNGSGNVDLANIEQIPYQFAMNFDRARLLRQDSLTVQVSGDIAVSGNKNGGRLGGKIHINEGEFYLPNQSSADIPELSIEETLPKDASAAKEKQSNTFPMQLDLAILVADKFFVRGRGLESEWKGDLKISGEAQQPILLGFLEVVRGHFNFLNKRFKFRQGKIDFLGAIPLKPRLNFDLAVQNKDILGILKLTGSPEKLNLKLQSEPMLPQDEILARILFDKNLSDISGFQALQLASAVKTLTSGGTDLSDFTRSHIGLDSLDINGDENSGKSVKAGKYISEKVFVEVESGISSGSSTVKVEMELTPSISVDSTVDEKSNTGFGINWKIDY